MHKLVLKIHEYLEQAALGNITVDQGLLKEYHERIGTKLQKQLEEQKEFKLRMSNIGRPLRQLMLEQKYGRGKPSPDFMLKMLFGDMYESLVLFLLKAAGAEITEQDTKVSLPIETAKGTVILEGELDVIIKINHRNKVYDIKSASPYSFDNKFNIDGLLTGDDAFGYVDQLFMYAKASGKKAGGWIVINKANGQIKVFEIPDEMHDQLMTNSIAKVQAKVAHITEGKPIPECDGVVAERFYQKPTGNFILSPSCKFCMCKSSVCHKDNISYMPDVNSKSKNPTWKYYLGKVIKPDK